jgi:hypothetical protein
LDVFQATLCNSVSFKRENRSFKVLLYCQIENMRENMPKHRKRCAGSIWDAGVKKKSLSYNDWPFSLAPASGLRSRTEWELSSSYRTDLQFSARFLSRLTLTSYCCVSCNEIHG